MQANEKTYRLYSCGRCANQVRICRDCDRGNLYCAGACALIRRRESLRRAAERYQSSYRGACLHAARQSTWRKRQMQKVTHRGSLPSTDALIVETIPTSTDVPHVNMVSIQSPVQPRARLRTMAPTHCCNFCWRALPRFARLGRLRGGP